MFSRQRTMRCELCSLNSEGKVLCQSCKEMVGRILSIPDMPPSQEGAETPFSLAVSRRIDKALNITPIILG